MRLSKYVFRWYVEILIIIIKYYKSNNFVVVKYSFYQYDTLVRFPRILHNK